MEKDQNNEDNNTNTNSKIMIGICAMEKKINSKHMQNILKGLRDFEEFEIIIFTEEIIFNLDIEVRK